MVASTQVSDTGAFFEKTKLWDPSKTLGILNTDPGYQCITCVGYAPSQRRRCRNPIRIDNRQFITATLNEISYLSPDSPIVASKLQAIAGPALCVRFHQGQASTILMQWKAKIQQLQPRPSDRRTTKSDQTSKQKVAMDQSVKNLQEELRKMQQLLDEMRRETSSTRYQDREEKKQEEQNEKERQERERVRQRRDERAREARKQEKDRQEKERAKKERMEEEQREKERVKREEEAQSKRERAAHAERIRQRAQKAREERECERKAKEQKEREQWDQRWIKYERSWVQFRASETRDRAAIPWPVKSGAYKDVKASSVKEFLKQAVPKDGNMAKLMRKECQKWHPDKIYCLIPSCQLNVADRMMIDLICRVVTELLNECSARSAEFLD